MKRICIFVLMIVCLFFCCTSCEEENIVNNSYGKSIATDTKNNNSQNTNSTSAVQNGTINGVDIDSQKKIAIIYEEYYNDKSNDIAIKAKSFVVYKKDIIAKQKIYQVNGYDEDSAKQFAIDAFIEKEIAYRLAVDHGITITKKELEDYINEQMIIAKSTNNSYLSFLKNITIEDVYNFERQNIEKDLVIQKYNNYFMDKYGENKAKEKYNKIIEKAKKSENIEILI